MESGHTDRTMGLNCNRFNFVISCCDGGRQDRIDGCKDKRQKRTTFWNRFRELWRRKKRSRAKENRSLKDD